MEVSGQLITALALGKEPLTPMNRRLGGEEKNLLPLPVF
jgi:hypothetical protein